MIATLRGTVDSVGGDSCVIEVNGVGYRVFMSLPALETLGRQTAPVKIFTHYHLREDGASLFGFLTPEDKRIFEMIISVSGIGPKTALAILGTLPGDRFSEAIRNEDHRVLTSVSGVGLKTAQRLVLELKGKLIRGSVRQTGGEPSAFYASRTGDAVDALVALGYPQKEAVLTVEEIYAADQSLNTPELVRQALKNLGRK